MAEYKVPPLVRGAGGGGKGGGSSRVAEEDPNTLRSKNVAEIIDLLGEGPIWGLVDGLKSVKLDGVAVQNSDNSFNYNGLILKTRQGYPDQSALPGSHNVQTEYAVSKEVRKDAPIVEGFTNAEADVINVKIQLQALSYQDKKTGDLRESSVALAIDMRNGVNGSWSTYVSRTISGKTVSPYQRQWKIRLPASDNPEWFVRVRRLTDDDQGTNYSNDFYFSSMTVITEAKLTYPDSALIGIKADASQFGTSIPERSYHIRGLIINVPSNYDPINRTYAGTWNGTFKKAWTNNPAWILYDLVTNQRYGAKQTQFDKWSLYSIGQYCDEEVPDGYGGVEPRFTCNLVLTAQEDAYAAIDSMASIFRGMIYWASSEIMAVADRPSSVVRQFTRSNIVDDFVRQGTSMKARHSVVLVTWNDPEDSYQKTIEMVTDQEMVEKWGWRQTELTQVGCTSRGQARRAGKWVMYTEKYETESISFKGTSDAMDLRPGDVIQISDPAVSGVRLGGRVMVTGTGALTLDRVDGIDPYGTWEITVTLPSGASETSAVSGFNGTRVTLVTPLTEQPVTGAVWTMSSTDVQPELFRVISLSDPGVELQPSITAISHNPGKYALVEEDIPLPARPTSLIPTGKLQPPTNLKATPHTYLEGTRKSQGITVSWTPSSDVRAVTHRLEVMGADGYAWKEVYAGSGVSHTIRNSSAGEWSFRVKSVDALGASSVWVYLVEQVTNKLMPEMPDSVDFSVSTLEITVNPVGSTDNQLWEVRRSDTPLASGLIESNSKLVGVGTSLVDTGLSPLRTYYYYVRGTNTFGESDWYATQATTEGDADAYLELLSGKLRATQLHEDLQTEIEKISGAGAGSIAERINAVNDRLSGVKEVLEDVDQGFSSDLERIDAAVVAAQEHLDDEVARIDATAAATQKHMEEETDRLDVAVAAAQERLGLIDAEVVAAKRHLDDEVARIDAEAVAAQEHLDDEVARMDAKAVATNASIAETEGRLEARDTALQGDIDAVVDSLAAEAERLDQSVADVVEAADVVRENLEGEVERLDTKVDGVEQAASNARSQLAQTDAEIQARVDAADQAILAETSVRESEHGQTVQSLNALTAKEDDSRARVTALERVTAESALLEAIQFSALEVTKAGASAAVRIEETARVDGDSALAQTITTLDARVEDAEANITTIDQARVDGDSALSSRIGELSAKLDATPTFGSGFEPGSDFDQWAVPAGETLTAVTSDIYLGTQSALVTSAKTAPDSSGVTGSVRADIPSGATEAFEGYEVVVTAAIKKPTINAATEIALAYSTNSVGNSTWQRFTPTTSWQVVEFRYNVPVGSDQSTDYIGIWADTSGSGKGVLIDAVNVRRANAEIAEITAAIESEQQARVDAVAALTSSVESLQTNFQGVNASLAQEQQTRADADSAMASDISSLQTGLGDAEASISSEAATRLTKDNALATRATNLESRMSGAESGISAEESARASAITAVTNQLAAANSRIDASNAAITSESNTRASADAAMAGDIDALETSVGEVEASVTAEAQARVSGDNALASRASSLETRMGDAESGITSEAQARASAMEAVAQSVGALEARLDDSVGTIVDESKVRAEEDAVLATQIGSVQGQVGEANGRIDALQRVSIEAELLEAIQFNAIEVTKAGASAAVRTEEYVRITETTSLASRATSLESRMGDAESEITNEASARSTADSALTQSINAQKSRIDDAEASITSEANTRADADSALTSGLVSANSRIDDVESSITSEAATRANKDSALTSQINQAKSRLDDAESAITSEANTRADADSALTSGLVSANSRIDDVESSITSEAATRANKDSALTSQINQAKSRLDDAESAITSEETTRADADSALTSQINQANSRIDDAESSITSEATTRASKDNALTTQINQANSRIDDVESSITSEATTRANKDSALTSQINQAKSRLDDAESAITSEETTRADADSALTSQISSANSRIDDTEGLIASEASTRASKDNALTTQINQANSRIDDAESSITSEATTRANKDSALTSQINQAKSRLDDAESAITSEASTRASEDSALSSRIDSVLSKANGNTSAINTEKTTRANAISALASDLETVEADAAGATAEVLSKVNAEASGRTLAPDGNFTQQLKYWQSSKTTLITRDRNGDPLYSNMPNAYGAIYLPGNEGTTRHATSEREAVVGGDIYSCYFSYAVDGDTNGELRFSIQWNDEFGSVGWHNISVFDVDDCVPGKWYTTEPKFMQAPDNATSGRIVMTMDSSSTKGRVAFTGVVASRADMAVTSELTRLASAVGDAESAITAEATTRASKDNALTTQINQANSRIDDAESSITSEATTRANKDSALTSQINSANSRIGDVESSVTSEATTRANKDNALSTRITAAQAKANSNAAAITSEIATRASKDDALSNRIDTAEATAANATAAVQNSLTTAVLGQSLVKDGSFVNGNDHWSDGRISLNTRDLSGGGFHSTMPAPYCAVFNDANQGTTRHVVSDFESVVAGDLYACYMWFAKMDSADGDIRMSLQFYGDDDELKGWPTVETAELSSFTSWTWQRMSGKTITVPEGASRGRVVVTLGSSNTQGRAAFTGVKAFRTDSILSEQIDTVQARLGDDIASVQTTATAQYNSLDNRLSAKWGVVLDNNGYVSGWGQENDGNTSTTIFRTDLFGVASPGGNPIYPFVIEDGKTVIQRGLLGNISSGILIDPATGESLTTVSGKMKADFIDVDNLEVKSAARFTGDMFSDDYQTGVKGWAILQNGKVEFNEASIRGNLEVSSVTVNGNSPSGVIRLSRGDVNFTSTAVHGSSSGDKEATYNSTDSVQDIPKGAKFELTLRPRIQYTYTIRGAVGDYSTNLQSKITVKLKANGVTIKDLGTWAHTRDATPSNLPWSVTSKHPKFNGVDFVWYADKYYNNLQFTFSVEVDLVNRLADNNNHAGPQYEFSYDATDAVTGTLSRLG